MKKNRLTALILTFVLLFGCLSVLPVFAEEAAEDGQVKIVAQNVVYSEKIQIAYAVDYDIDTAENDVKLAYTVDGETKLATYWGVENVKGTDYPVFVTEGFHANEFTKQVSAVAYTGEEAPADATPKLYSVGQYFYSMLYKQDYINATTDENIARKDLYESAIAFGSNAQRVLDKKAADSADLLNQYCFLWAAEGVTINGDDAALVPAGTAVTLGGADTYNIGEATEITEYTAVAGVKALVTGNNAAVEPEPEEPVVPVIKDYEDGTFASDYVKSYYIDDSQNAVLVEADVTDKNTRYQIYADPTGAANKCLRVVNKNATGIQGYTNVTASNENATGNCYTFETRIYADDVTDTYVFAQLKFANANGAALQLNLSNNGGNIKLATTGNYAVPTKGTDLISESGAVIDGWFTLRLEYYHNGADATKTDAYLKVYINDTLQWSGIAYLSASDLSAEITHVEIGHYKSAKQSVVYYDDISLTRTDKAYVEGNN